MEKKYIAIIATLAAVAVIAVASIIVVSDDGSDDEGESYSYNLGTKTFESDTIGCQQTGLGFGDAGAVTYSVSSRDSGWSYNGITMYDVHIEIEVATNCTTRDFTVRGTFSGSANLVEEPTTNYSDLVYQESKGDGFDQQWFGYSYRLDSVYTYVFKIDAKVLLDSGDAGLALQFSVVFIDDPDTYIGYAGADIEVRQSTAA